MTKHHPHEHDHGSHRHGEGELHSSAAANIRLAFLLNLGFTVVEAVGGWWTNSFAVISDAFHDLGDALLLGLAWYLSHVARKGRDARYSYGYGRYAILGGVLMSLVLVVGSCVLLVFSALRLADPQEPHAQGMMLLAVFGLLMNGYAAWRLHGGASLNERGAYLHLLEDVLGWAAVLVGAAVIHFTGLTIIDPLLSIGINLFVLYNALRNLWSGAGIMLQQVPAGFDEERVTKALRSLPDVTGVHDQHAWTMDGRYVVYSVHLDVDTDVPERHEQVKQVARETLTGLGVHHATIEIDRPGATCPLRTH